ncbi:hypothetical protein Tco_1279252, partial [Tanacetum coccineum]
LVLLTHNVTPSDIQHSAAYSDLRVLHIFRVDISFSKQESLLCLACDYIGYSPSLTGSKDLSRVGSNNDDDDMGDLDDYLIPKDAPYYVDEEEERLKERRSKLLGIPYKKPSTFKSEKFEVIKYSFGPAEEYVAIRKYEYDIWVKTKENVFTVYQDIFTRKMKGGS